MAYGTFKSVGEVAEKFDVEVVDNLIRLIGCLLK